MNELKVFDFRLTLQQSDWYKNTEDERFTFFSDSFFLALKQTHDSQENEQDFRSDVAKLYSV